jgi:uncharacterized protein (DUF1015 family)
VPIPFPRIKVEPEKFMWLPLCATGFDIPHHNLRSSLFYIRQGKKIQHREKVEHETARYVDTRFYHHYCKTTLFYSEVTVSLRTC